MSARVREWVPSLGSGRVGESISLEGEGAHHVARVMRVRVGDALVLFDGAGNEAEGRVQDVSVRGAVRVSVELTSDRRGGILADRAGVIWLQGYPKGDKLDTIVRQATELGASAIWPVYTARSVPRARSGTLERTERLRAIARSAAAQSGRSDVPEVREGSDLETALSALPPEVQPRLLPWEESSAPIGGILARAARLPQCAVLVGPEGGLGEEEVQLAQRHGFTAVSLGPRIWRTETVAPALLAILSLSRGDLAQG